MSAASGPGRVSAIVSAVVSWTAHGFLRVAISRWPPSLRDDRRREWLSELHVLAADRHRSRMLSFALSLALTRPAVDPRAPFARRTLANGRFWASAAMLGLGPPGAGVGLGLLASMLTAMGVFGLILIASLAAFCAWQFALAGCAGAVVRRRFALPAVLLPSLAVLLYLPGRGDGGLSGRLAGPSLLWTAIMAVVLVAVAVTPRPAAWWVGFTGVVAASWAAVTWAVWAFNARGLVDPGDGTSIFHLDTSYAWLWFPSALLELDLGPGADGLGGYHFVSDFTEFYPHALLMLGLYAFGYVVGVNERRDFAEMDAVAA